MQESAPSGCCPQAYARSLKGPTPAPPSCCVPMPNPTELPTSAAWTSCEIDGHLLEAFLPPSDPGRPPGAILHLRDRDDQAPSQLPAWRQAIESSPLPVVSLAGGTSWWLDRVVGGFDARLSPEAFIRGPLTDGLRERFGLPAAAIATVGQGSGCQGALRLSYRHPAAFPVAAAVLPTIDFHRTMESGEPGSETLWELYGDVEVARQQTAILYVHPLNWPRHQAFWAHAGDLLSSDGADRLHSKLIALGIFHEAELAGPVDAAAWLRAAAVAAIRFAAERLERDSRRIA